jgi:hypothetical protein
MDRLVVYGGAAHGGDRESKYTLFVWICVMVTNVVNKVVYGDSAIVDYAREYRETIYADHICMTKFSSKSDPGYKKVLHAIEMLLEGPSEGEHVQGVWIIDNRSNMTNFSNQSSLRKGILGGFSCREVGHTYLTWCTPVSHQILTGQDIV